LAWVVLSFPLAEGRAQSREGVDRTAGAANEPQDVELRMRVRTDHGTLVVYDAAVPAAHPRDRAGYVAYWNDWGTERLYVFERLIFAPADTAAAIFALERDLGIDGTALSDALKEIHAATGGNHLARAGQADDEWWLGTYDANSPSWDSANPTTSPVVPRNPKHRHQRRVRTP